MVATSQRTRDSLIGDARANIAVALRCMNEAGIALNLMEERMRDEKPQRRRRKSRAKPEPESEET